ncbi:hypothetical protein ACOJR9_17470 [Alteromonas sp. A081]
MSLINLLPFFTRYTQVTQLGLPAKFICTGYLPQPFALTRPSS